MLLLREPTHGPTAQGILEYWAIDQYLHSHSFSRKDSENSSLNYNTLPESIYHRSIDFQRHFSKPFAQHQTNKQVLENSTLYVHTHPHEILYIMPIPLSRN